MVLGTILKNYSKTIRQPRFNEIIVPFSGSVYPERTATGKKKRFMQLYKISPELNALVNMVAYDIVEDWHFEPLDKSVSNRNRIKQAEEFCSDVNMRSTLISQSVDILDTGESFGWLGFPDLKEVSKICDMFVKKEIGMELKELSAKTFLSIKEIDESLLSPRKYRYLASSSMAVKYDEYDIIGYEQDVNGKKTEFTPKQIVHFNFLNIDGKVNGFSPVECVAVQMELLRIMWQNQHSLQKKGYPDKIFNLKNINVNSPAYKRIEQQLEKYNIVEERHGNLVFTGDMEIFDLMQLDKMQFQDVGLYITGLLAMQWSIPTSRLSLIGKEKSVVQGTVTGNAERSYWMRIETYQRLIEDCLNTQIFNRYFKVNFRFNKSYKHDEVVENTAMQLRLDNMYKMNSMLMSHQKKLSLNQVLTMLNGGFTELREEDLDVSEIIDNPQNPGYRQGMVDQRLLSPEKQDMSKAKKNEQEQSTLNKGKPSGFGSKI